MLVTNKKNPNPSFKNRCSLCGKGILNIDYKNTELLNKYISYNGKILPRRISKICAKHQRMVSNAIKRARIVALMPFVKE
jgi:small subunit ribosomal protein S18